MPAISNEQIEALLNKPASTGISPWDFTLTYQWPQAGAIHVHAKEMRCTNMLPNGKECRCSSHHTVDGKIRCLLCAVRELNELVAELRG